MLTHLHRAHGDAVTGMAGLLEPGADPRRFEAGTLPKSFSLTRCMPVPQMNSNVVSDR